MNDELRVKCPECNALCSVAIESGDLEEDLLTEYFIGKCLDCDCRFQFDVYVETQNKVVLTEEKPHEVM
jgi:hypothetical protein